MLAGTERDIEPLDHVVRFYADDAELVEVVAAFALEGIRSGGAVVLAATADHTRALEAALAASSLDPAEAVAAGRLVTLDADEVTTRLVATGRLDPDLFDSLVAAPIRLVQRGDRPVRVFGEIVALLWDSGQVLAAVEVEELWNGLHREVPFALLCGYRAASFGGPEHEPALERVYRLHSVAIGLDSGESDGKAGWDRQERARFRRSVLAPAAARHFVLDTLRRWGRAELTDDAAVIVSELAANGIKHARSDLTVTLSEGERTVRISVQDASPAMPTVPRSSRVRRSGRGLILVGASARRWGCDRTDLGKVVWAEL